MTLALLRLSLSLLGCRDPELAPYKDDLAIWDEGKAALAAGDPALAAERFARLAELDPASPTARAWHAHALDLSGDAAAALAVLDEALARFPEDPTLRYNHAALLARADRVEEAARDLRILYASGGADPLDVGMDPDFQSVANSVDFASLAPPPTVDLGLQGEEGPVLLGEEANLELSVSSLGEALVSITDMGEPSGALRHTRTVEDIVADEGRQRRRLITVSWRTLRAGSFTLGPWLVAAGGVSAVSERVGVDVLGLPGRVVQGAPDEAGTVRSVEALFSGHEPPWAGREGRDLLVVLPPGGRAEVRGADGAADPGPVTLELRRAGQTVALGELHRIPGAAEVIATRAGQELLRARVPPAEPEAPPAP